MTDSPLSPNQTRSLRCLAEMMIPASTAYNVPSAADDAIFADILRSFGRDAEHVQAAIRTLDALAGGAFAELPPARREAVAAQWRQTAGTPQRLLSRIILQCYYRDDRVMRSLDME